jgi:hypothetical protein
MTEPADKPTRRKRIANKGRTVASCPEAIDRKERDLQCVKLRHSGKTFQQIAGVLGYASPGHAHNGFMRVMKDYPREDVETVRDMISNRYDALIEAIWPKAMGGDLGAVDRVLRICDQQARLLGANRPEKLEISAGASALDAALRELEAELRARAAGHPVGQG